MSTLTKNRFGKLLMSLGVACLTSTSSLLAASYNNSFAFDLTQASDPPPPAYLPASTEIDLAPLGPDREFSEDGTWMGTGGALMWSVLNLPEGDYDITISGDGPYSGGQFFTVTSGDNSYTADLSHGGVTISDFHVTAGQPLDVTAMAGLAIAYASGISFYGPKGDSATSFGFDLTQAADPPAPASLPASTEIDLAPLGPDREFSEDGTWMGTGGALDFSVLNLPAGTYDITISGDGAYSGGQTFTVTSGDNSYTSDLSHGGVTISDFQVTEGQPLDVRATAGLAIAYLSGISFYGPKSP